MLPGGCAYRFKKFFPFRLVIRRGGQKRLLWSDLGDLGHFDHQFRIEPGVGWVYREAAMVGFVVLVGQLHGEIADGGFPLGLENVSFYHIHMLRPIFDAAD